jgi:hypothetical protein
MLDATDVEDESWVLSTTSGAKLLAEVAANREPGPASLARWRKWATPGRVSAAIRITTTRRGGASKFTLADQMWFTSAGLEQATQETVALAKARRFPSGPIVDLCSGIGGDAIALAKVGPVLAVDREPGMGRRLRWNTGVHGVADRVVAVTAVAERFVLPSGAWLHIDPDRRSGRPRAGRAQRLDGYAPGLPRLRAWIEEAPGGAIKLGPASDFEEAFQGAPVEVELVSVRGECKEATLWFGAARTCRRRATRLPDNASWTDRDGPTGPSAVGPLLDWIFDPDPALIRAGLLDGFVTAHALRRVAPGINLLTGSGPVHSPFLTPFIVLSVHSLDMKILKREVGARGLGPLEIKPRGVDLRPEVVRERLRPMGDRPGTLFLIGGQSPGLAVLATRVSQG